MSSKTVLKRDHNPLDTLEALSKIDRPRALELMNKAFRKVKEINGGKGVYEMAFRQVAKRLMCVRYKSYETGKKAECYLDGVLAKHWPYGLMKLENELWMPFGYKYSPLGCPQHEFVRYEAHHHLAMRFECDPHTVVECTSGYKEPDRLYLYDKGLLHTNRDFEEYLRRVGRVVDATGERAMEHAARLLRTLPPE